jgi:hypothetical protein
MQALASGVLVVAPHDDLKAVTIPAIGRTLKRAPELFTPSTPLHTTSFVLFTLSVIFLPVSSIFILLTTGNAFGLRSC